MQTTPNLGLKMPAQEDFYNIEDHNANSRIIDSKYKELSDLISAVKSELLDATYPIGSIYMSVNKTDPGTLFGGKWAKLPAGRCLIGAGSYTPTDTSYSTGDASTTYIAGTQGGQRQRYITSSCLPNHTHTARLGTASSHSHVVPLCDNLAPSGSVSIGSHSSIEKTANYEHRIVSSGSQGVIRKDDGMLGAGANYYVAMTESAGSHAHSLTIDTAGSGNAMPVQSPYLVVNMWQRTD